MILKDILPNYFTNREILLLDEKMIFLLENLANTLTKNEFTM